MGNTDGLCEQPVEVGGEKQAFFVEMFPSGSEGEFAVLTFQKIHAHLLFQSLYLLGDC